MRKFKGELFPKRSERNFEKKRLKAYLNGWEVFSFGGPSKDNYGRPVRAMYKTETGMYSHSIPAF